MTRVIGIDLGTSHSVAAALEKGRPILIPNAEGSYLTPSVVAFPGDGGRLVGQIAERQATTNPHRTIFSIKRRMGSAYKAKANGRSYTPQEVSAFILQKIKRDAESYLGEKVEKAVITVPAYFNDHQRQATKDAGTLAGLEVLRILNEPTAACLAYGLQHERIHKVLVWDLGGGTFDVSILDLGPGFFQVQAVNGNTHLGGDDWDQRIVDHLLNELQEQQGVDLRQDLFVLQRLREAAEEAKIKLSAVEETPIRIPCLWRNHNVEASLTREKFEELTADLLNQMVAPTRQALADADLKPTDLDRVVLVGGATRMPAVQALVKRLLGLDPYQEIDPDLVVAMGAAIQAGILTHEIQDVVLLDVTPLSLGIETDRGVFAALIHRNTTIPVCASQIFTNARDAQEEINVHILQGERAMAEDNISLGRFQLPIAPLRRGQSRLEISVTIDVDGIAHFRAQDIHSGEERSIVANTCSRLPAEEISRLVREAQENAAEDKEREQNARAQIRAANAIELAETRLQQACHHEQAAELTEATLALNRAISSGERERIEGKIKRLQEILTKSERQTELLCREA